MALNCVANGKLLQSGLFKRIWIQPASGDAGGALGAALAYWHIALGKERTPEKKDAMRGSYLGPAYGLDDILRVCKQFPRALPGHAGEKTLVETVADLLAEGNVVGWFQGRMEYGPRALGNRSILGDPRNPEMQKRLNLKIKYREGFRPFGALSAGRRRRRVFRTVGYFTLYASGGSGGGTVAQTPCPKAIRLCRCGERLYFQRSELPSITHIDYSARVQTISRETNPRYWALARAFKDRHGCPVLINTSFNVRGEPVVCSPQDAYVCFMRTEMDYLVLGDVLLAKADQPALPDDGRWRTTYVLD